VKWIEGPPTITSYSLILNSYVIMHMDSRVTGEALFMAGNATVTGDVTKESRWGSGSGRGAAAKTGSSSGQVEYPG